MKQTPLISTFLDQSRSQFWTINPKFELLYANKTYLELIKKITGVEKKLNVSVFEEGVNEAETKKWKSYYSKAFKGVFFEIEEQYFNSITNETEYIQVTFEPLINEDDHVFAVACQSKNITKIVKEKSKASELINASLDVFCTINEDNQFVHVSAAAEEHWGYKPEELIGKRYHNLILEEDIPKTLEVAAQILNGEESKTFLNRYKKKNGGIAYNSWSVRWDDASKLAYCVIRDVKDKVVQEEKIVQSEQRFKALVQEGSDVSAIIDKEGYYTYMSPASTPITGIPPEQFIGRNALEFVHPDDLENTIASLKKVITENRVVTKTYRLKDPLNEWRYVETVFTNMLNNPAVNGIVANSRNITELINYQENLKESKNRLEESLKIVQRDESLLKQAGKLTKIGAYEYLNEGDQLYMTEEIYTLFGLKVNDTPTLKQIYDLLMDSSRDKMELAAKNIETKGIPYDLELELIDFKKEHLWIHIIAQPILNASQEIIGRRGVIQDITDQKQVEIEILKSKEKLKVSEENFREMFNNMGSCVARYKVTNNGNDFIFADINAAGENSIQVKKESVVGKSIFDVLPNMKNFGLTKVFKEVWETGESGNFEEKLYVDENILGFFKNYVYKLSNGDIVAIFEDITESIQAKEKLIKAKEIAEKNAFSMREAGRLAKIGYWGYDKRTNSVNWSDTIHKIYGTDPKKEVPKIDKILRVFTQESRKKFIEATEELETNGVSFELELQMINFQNKNVWIRNIGQPVYNANHEIIGRKGVTQDITAEKKLRELNREVGKLARIGSWEIDIINHNLFWSDEVHELYQTDPQTFVPSIDSAINFYREDFRHLALSEFNNCIKTGKPYVMEAVVVNNLQKEFWVRTNAKAEFIDGICTRVYGSFQDIDERKQSELRLESFANNLPGVAYQYKIDANGNDSIQYVSKGSKEVWGLAPNEIMENMDLAWHQIEAGGDMDKVKKSIAQSIETKTQWTCSYNYVLPSGGFRTHTAHGLPNFLADGSVLFNSIVLDITQEAKNEQMLQEATKLARIGSWEMDLIHQETDTMYWSPMVREILEVDDDYNPSLTGGLEFNMGESYEKIKTAIDLLITNGTPFDEETLVRTAKGNERWVRAIGKLEIINGKPIKIYGSYQDIHFSKSLELKVSEILESISDAFFAVDKDWRITYWNEEAELIMGKTRKQVIGKHLWEEYPDAIDSDFYREYHKSMKTGEKADFEEFYPALSKWLQVSVYPSKNGLSIYFKDISERKKAEEENNQLQITIENSMNEIYTFDATTLQFNYANRGALLNLGYSKKEITSFSPHHIKTGYTEASFKQLIQPLLSKEKEKIIFFTNHQRKDGSKYPVETHLQLVSEGIHPQFLAIAMDLTEHKKAEEMYRLLADHTNDLICMHNSDTSITYLSPSIKNLLGFEPEELLGKQVFDLIHKDDIKPVKEAIRDTFFQGVIIETFAYRARHKKGHYLWLETLGSPVIQDKEVISFVTSSRNITQAMLVKQEIQEYQSSLQRLTSEMSFIEENQKKQIAANIHDHLSQSLVISKMKISNLEKRTELKDIVEDLGFIKSHISEALENSRKITYELSPPILFQLGLIEALDWYTEEIQEKYGIEFRFNSTIDSFDFDEFKSILIFRCVQEVVTNAIKYAKASLMTLEFIVEDTAIVLFVKDNGIGFNIGNLKGLNSSDGGFGLFKVQERIRNMKGEFSITSALQKGTVVKISVPL